MKRTKHPSVQVNIPALLAQVASRMSLAGSLVGQQTYGGARDIYQALGYMTSIKYTDFYARYKRQDMAKAIIDRPATITWSGKLTLTEPNVIDGDFEKAWNDLNKELKVKSRLVRLDKLVGIGKYGVLLLGLDDVSNGAGFARPVTSGARKLHYLKPYGEGSAEILEYEKDPTSSRYGLPLLYLIGGKTTEGSATVEDTTPIRVHYTRVIHVAGDLLESEVFGTPKLEAVFNRLMDLEKLVGGDAEMFWRGARPGFAGKVDPEFMMTPETKKELQEQITEYENDLRRILVNEGVDLESLAQQIADPKNHVDVQISMISAVTGIPKRILIGSERGELSSGQDRSEWLSFVETRRRDYAEPLILRPVVDKFIEYGILPKPKEDDYAIQWEDLLALTEKDKMEIGKGRASALKEYATNPVASAMVPFKAFVRYFLGLADEDILAIKQMQDEEIGEEQAEWQQMRDTIAIPPKPEVAPAEAKKENV